MVEQTDSVEVFDSLKNILEKYSSSFTEGAAKTDKHQYHLWSKNRISIGDRKPKQVYFVGISIQKNFVGFYYMPVYADTKLKNFFEPELLSLLKGKSCFHIKRLDSKLKKQITTALNLGFQEYKKRGWM